jgi:parallel beta-helix repeat protein
VVTQNDGYGIRIYNSDNVLVEDSNISHTGTGIQVFGHGSNVVIRNNDVHDNDRMITNTQNLPDDDTGAIGIDLNQSTGGVLVTGNDLWGNRAHSFDYTWDGGAFDIYSASNATITGNRRWDNENILETGRGSTQCNNNTFTYNQAWAATTQGRSWGIFLRCGANMLIAHNSLIGIERFVISLADDGSTTFAGSIDGARIVDNILVGTGNGKVFGLPATGTLPASVSVEHDLVWSPNGVIATVVGGNDLTTLAQLRSATGYEMSGISGDPKVVDAANGDLRLTNGSPAIDAGVVLPTDTQPFNGTAPDLGALESGP